MARQWCVDRNHWILLLVREHALRTLILPIRTLKRESHLRGKETNVAGWQMNKLRPTPVARGCGLEQAMEAVRTAPPFG